MKSINVHEAKTNLSAILSEIEKGKVYLICRNGKPVAELLPHRQWDRLKPHPVLKKIKINYDPTEVLSKNEWGAIS